MNTVAWVEGNTPNFTDPLGLDHCIDNKLNDGIRLYVEQNVDDDFVISRPIPFRIPEGSDILPNWIVRQVKRVCDQLCNPDHEDNVFKHLNQSCSNEANQICNYLCEDRPQNPDLEDDYEHNGLFLRWMQYYIDLNDTRDTHEFPYHKVQGYLDEYMRDSGFGAVGGCGSPTSEAEVVRELSKIAGEWSKKELEIPAKTSLGSEEVVQPEPAFNPSPSYETCLWVNDGICMGDLSAIEEYLVAIGIGGLVLIGGVLIAGGGSGSLDMAPYN